MNESVTAEIVKFRSTACRGVSAYPSVPVGRILSSSIRSE